MLIRLISNDVIVAVNSTVYPFLVLALVTVVHIALDDRVLSKHQHNRKRILVGTSCVLTRIAGKIYAVKTNA